MNDLVTQYHVQTSAPQPVDVRASGTKYPEDWFFEAMAGGQISQSGIAVSPANVMSQAPVWQAVNILAGDIGQIPLRKMVREYKRDGAVLTQKDRSSKLDRLVRERVNHYQTPSKWKEKVMYDALIWGNHISVIWADDTGAPTLLPLPPDSTTYDETGPYQFVIKTRIDNQDFEFQYSDCVHVASLAGDQWGFWGMSLAKVCKNVLGHGMAQQEYGNRLFANGARPAGVLEHPGSLTGDARKNIRDDWNTVHRGSDNAGKVGILWEGMKYNAIAMNNQDAQYIELVALNRELIASLFNLPAFKLNSMENSAVRANLEEQNRDYFMTSLSRWTNKISEELDRKLLQPGQRNTGKHFFHWFPESFLKGNAKARAEIYASGITNRWLNPNEVREMEDMNPYPGGDEYSNPAIEPSPSSEEAAEEPPAEEPDEQEQAVQNLLVDRVENLLQQEQGRIRTAATHSLNFVEWLDEFYCGYANWAGKLLAPSCDAATLFGYHVTPQAALADYGDSRRAELLLISGEVDQDGLTSRVAQFCQEADDQRIDRARTLTKRFYNGKRTLDL